MHRLLPFYPLGIGRGSRRWRVRGLRMRVVGIAGAINLAGLALRLLVAVDPELHQRPVINTVAVNIVNILVVVAVTIVGVHNLVVVAVLVGRRGRVRGRRDGGRDGDVVGEHGHELLVVQSIERSCNVVGAVDGGVPMVDIVEHIKRRLEERNGVAGGAAVRPAPGGGEVKELVHPAGRRRLLLRGRRRRRRVVEGGGGGGEEVGHGGHYSVVGEGRPILSHAGYFRR